MNICFFVGNIELSGGTERVTSIISNELYLKGYNISVLSLNKGIESFFRSETNIKKETLSRSGRNHGILGYIRGMFRLRKYIIKNRIDVIIDVESMLVLYSIPALLGVNIRHVCWEHFNFNINLGVKLRDLGRKWAAKYCDYIVTLTNRDMELWQQGLGKINAKIISIANPTPYENTNHRANLSSKTVLAMGRLTYQKGFDLLIQAWAEVCKVNMDWVLKIVGSGEDESKLKQQVINLGLSERVNFIPVTRNVTLQYQSASIYCLSSRFEGFPVVLLEAISFELPIVAFDCDTGPSELISDNGFLIEPKNHQKYAEALVDISSSKFDIPKHLAATKILRERLKLNNIIEKWVSLLSS